MLINFLISTQYKT